MIKLQPINDDVMRQNLRAIEMADTMNYKRNQDAEFNQNRIILTSPNGTRYALVVSNAGTLSTTVVV